MATQYRVRVTNEFTSVTGAPARRRAGIEIPVVEGFLGELSKDQLAELQADQYVTVTNEDGSELTSEKGTEPSHADLKARAKELGISVGGKKDELAARIAEAEAAGTDAQPQGDPAAAEAKAAAEGDVTTPAEA